MKKLTTSSALLSKYMLLLEKNPRSRVFAPLADVYRKLGMIDESLRLLKEGIKKHPTYTLGYIVLSHCYYDLSNFETAYNTLKPFRESNLENITLQRLYAKICMELGYHLDALETYKHILILSEVDDEARSSIAYIEENYSDESTSSREEAIEPTVNDDNLSNEDDWVQVNFSKKSKKAKKDSADNWERINPLESFKESIKENKIKVEEHKLDDNFFYEDYDTQANDVIDSVADEVSVKDSDAPIITHTLVDLYCSQGHTGKAIEILQNILDIHPDDKATKSRLANLLAGNDDLGKEAGVTVNEASIETEDIGQKNLESMVDSIHQSPKLDLIKEKFSLFEKALQKRVKEKTI